MVCLYCGAGTAVINSRHQKRPNNIWRRRQCSDCGAVFTTIESPDLLKSLVVIDGKRVQAFSRDKLFISIHDSLKHRKTAINDSAGLTDTIIGQLYPVITSGSVTSGVITSHALTILKRFDKAAASYYLAYHPVSS